MEKCVLGRTGLSVTQLGYGAMELRGNREISEDEVGRLLNGLLDSGINFIDTAPCYGISEERIGRHISSRRGEYFLATKCGCNVYTTDPQEPRHKYARDMLLRNIDESLGRLKVDYLDIWQLHNPPVDDIVNNGLADVMREIKAAGKVRFISISTRVPEFIPVLEMGCFDTFQIPYSAFERKHEDLITQAGEAGIGIIIRGGVARGRIAEDHNDQDALDIWAKAKIDELLNGMPRAEFMLRFTLSHPYCQTTIVGTSKWEHMKQNLASASNGPLSADIYEEAKRRLSAAGMVPGE